MSAIRVLRLYHSGVVDEYRERERLLRARHGYDVHLVCPPAWSEGGILVSSRPDPTVPVHVVPVRGGRHPILFWYATGALRRVVREVRPQIVDIHEEPYSLAAAATLRVVRSAAPDARICIYTAQNILKRYPLPFRRFERRALADADAAYPCSTEAGEVLRAKGFRGPLHVLPLGVTLPPRRPDESSDGTLWVGFLGRLEPYKGGMIAVEAFAQVAREVDARLELVGSGSQQEELRERADRLGVGDRVFLPGAISQTEALERIGGYDVLLVPSLTTPKWKEQFGRVAAQAMAAGTPVVASTSGSLPELLADCGELVPEGDVDALAKRLSVLLRDSERRAELAVRGRRRAAEVLSWEKVSDGCDLMYKQVLGSPIRAAYVD